MEKKEIGQQIKLGAFVLVGVGLFIVSAFFIGSENNIFSKTIPVMAEFKNVEGLKEGDNVWLSGVKVGTVRNVQICAEGKVLVKLMLKNNQSEFIKKDATASIGSDGLVGNKIVVIRPGTATESINPDDTLKTASPADTQELINIAKDVGENTRSLTTDLSLIARRINEGNGVVGELLNDGAIAQEIRRAVTNLAATGNNTAQASAELTKLLTEMRTGSGLLPTLVSDSSYANSFKKSISNIEQVSVNAEAVSKNLQELATKFNDDNNPVGVLLNDKETAERLKNTVQNAEQASQKLDKNMEAMQHNFLFRGYFRKQAKKAEKEAASSATSKNEK